VKPRKGEANSWKAIELCSGDPASFSKDEAVIMIGDGFLVEIGAQVVEGVAPPDTRGP